MCRQLIVALVAVALLLFGWAVAMLDPLTGVESDSSVDVYTREQHRWRPFAHGMTDGMWTSARNVHRRGRDPRARRRSGVRTDDLRERACSSPYRTS